MERWELETLRQSSCDIIAEANQQTDTKIEEGTTIAMDHGSTARTVGRGGSALPLQSLVERVGDAN